MSKPRATIIYIPGLGDDNPKAQRLVVRLWSIYGYKGQLVQMSWDDQVSWSVKFGRITKAIELAQLSGRHKVALVGASAGATAAINAYTARPDNVAAVITIAGKINRPETLGPKYRTENPSFIASITEAQNSLKKLKVEDKQKILCIYSDRDGLVASEDSIVDGAASFKTRVPHHPFVIAWFLTVGFYKINKHIRLLTKGV